VRPTEIRLGSEIGRSASARAKIQTSGSPFTGPNKVEGKVCVSLRKMNLHYKISPGIDLSDNRAVEIRWFKSFTAYETASVESGGGGGGVVQRRAGDLR
jgi:hypothetical protein